MTVDELRLLLEALPGHYEVRYEYDGSDAYVEKIVKAIDVSPRNETICFSDSDEEL